MQRDPNDRRHVPMKARLDQWSLVRHSRMAREAARLGVSWSLKCLIIGDAKLPSEINLQALVRAKQSAALTAARIQAGKPLKHWSDDRNLGVMNPKVATTALQMFDTIALLEAETQEEIARHTMESDHEP